tara:strand:- start:1586 stop:2062 length:477 start_codon:yes stop_codon:yes gene_type:complete
MKKVHEKSDYGNEIRIKKDDEFREENISINVGSKKRRRILTQSSIDRYFQREQITSQQYNTALYIYAIYQRSEKNIISSYNPDSRISRSTNDDRNIVGFCDYMQLTKHLPQNLFNVIQHIVIYGFSANEYDKKFDNKRKTLDELRKALDILAKHFRIR